MANNNVATELDATGFLWRFLASLTLVLLTFNPSGYSAYHWIADAIGDGTFGPLHVIGIIVLVIGWAIVIEATRQSLNTFGVVLAALAGQVSVEHVD
jgi:hypothetical protein